MKNLQENKYWIWLSSLKLEKNIIIKLLKKYEQPNIIYNLKESELRVNNYINENSLYKILSITNKNAINYYIEYMNKNNIKVISIKDKEYPSKLKNIYDFPICIYCKGNIELLNKKSIAIVGSRMCTNYGKIVAQKISSQLYNKNIIIVSGLARGIDTYAHIGAIKKEAKTIAVLGSRIR